MYALALSRWLRATNNARGVPRSEASPKAETIDKDTGTQVSFFKRERERRERRGSTNHIPYTPNIERTSINTTVYSCITIII